MAVGKSYSSACTSCGRARVTGPQSAGSVSTRATWGSVERSCSGRVIRSKYRDTGRKASLTDVVGSPKCSTCWSTGSGALPVKVSPGSSSTGSRFACASPAAVTMFNAPGPTEEVATMTCRRSIARA